MVLYRGCLVTAARFRTLVNKLAKEKKVSTPEVETFFGSLVAVVGDETHIADRIVPRIAWAIRLWVNRRS